MLIWKAINTLIYKAKETCQEFYNLESKIYSGDSNRGQHEVSTQITILK